MTHSAQITEERERKLDKGGAVCGVGIAVPAVLVLFCTVCDGVCVGV